MSDHYWYGGPEDGARVMTKGCLPNLCRVAEVYLADYLADPMHGSTHQPPVEIWQHRIIAEPGGRRWHVYAEPGTPSEGSVRPDWIRRVSGALPAPAVDHPH